MPVHTISGKKVAVKHDDDGSVDIITTGNNGGTRVNVMSVKEARKHAQEILDTCEAIENPPEPTFHIIARSKVTGHIFEAKEAVLHEGDYQGTYISVANGRNYGLGRFSDEYFDIMVIS